MVNNFPELINNTNPRIHEAKQKPHSTNKNKYTARHIIMKLPNTKDKEKKNLKSNQRKKDLLL